ncbi:MAG: PspA/IM30 family protein [Pseudomonadales bacterium]|nr:PspA/IM30 family protein [Pseudomonadales bacterium]
MSLWRKLNTLFRATSQEPLHQLVDANSIRIFEQELREAEQAVVASKRELACVIAEKNRMQRHAEQLQESIELREQQATRALDKQQETLALELAEVIAGDESLLHEQHKQVETLKKQEADLRKQLKQVVQGITRYRGELRMAQANQNAEQALRHLSGRSNGLHSHMADMSESLNRIKHRQERFSDFDAALSSVEADLDGRDLNGKLKQAGIETGQEDAKAVLERLRKKQAA